MTRQHRGSMNGVNLAKGLIGIATFLAAWQFLSVTKMVDPVLLPPPTDIFKSSLELLQSGELAKHAAISARRAAGGFVVGALPAIVIGLLTARLPRLAAYVDPLLQMFRSIPPLALVPFGVFWFGIGETSKIALVAWSVFFPVWVNTEAGVREVSPLLVRAAFCLGAKRWQMFFFVHLPAALHYIITGLKVSLSAAISTLVAAELAGAVYGLGYLVQISQQVFRVDLMFVGLIALGMGSLIVNRVFDICVKALAPWYGGEREAVSESA